MSILTNFFTAGTAAQVQRDRGRLLAQKLALGGHPIRAAKAYLGGHVDSIKTTLRGYVGMAPAKPMYSEEILNKVR